MRPTLYSIKRTSEDAEKHGAVGCNPQLIQEDRRLLCEHVDYLERQLAKIARLDPNTDSVEGLNEWGEADCFEQAQIIAREALQTDIGARKES